MKQVLMAALFASVHLTSLGQGTSVDVQSKEMYRYYLVVNYSDDRLVVRINDAVIYSKSTDNDPWFEDRKEITSFLQKSTQTSYINKLIVEGYNGETVWNTFGRIFGGELQYNPWHFKYRIEKVNNETGKTETLINQEIKGPSPTTTGPGYLAGSWTHEIVKE